MSRASNVIALTLITESKQTNAVTLHPNLIFCISNGSHQKAKVQIKRQKTSLGWAYRIYIDGNYMGTGLTQASARDGAKRMLVIYQRSNSRALKASIAASRESEYP